jgi:hypothetical protein
MERISSFEEEEEEEEEENPGIPVTWMNPLGIVQECLWLTYERPQTRTHQHTPTRKHSPTSVLFVCEIGSN